MTQENLAPAPDRRFLPAMGKRWLLPLYDPFTRFAGVAAVHGALLARAEVGPGNRVLDIGCGTGSLLVTLGRKEPDAVLTGLDPDPAALGRARRKAARAGVQVSLDRGFADELPYPDASLDRVLSSMMLHHLDPADRARALAEAHRVLRPGGRFVLIDAGPTPRAGTIIGWGVIWAGRWPPTASRRRKRFVRRWGRPASRLSN